MKYIDVDQIRAEIGWLKDEYTDIAIDSHYGTVNANHVVADLEQLLSLLDTLPEQPVIKKSNALFDECVKNCDPAVMKEVSDNIDKMLGRQPVEGLEEAAEEYRRESYRKSVLPNIDGPMPEYGGSIKDAFIAGAEWQKERTAWVYLKEAKDAVIALEKEKGEPLNPRVAFVNGARWQKQQMLEGAVEGTIHQPAKHCWTQVIVQYNGELKHGDKVKIIVIKED